MTTQARLGGTFTLPDTSITLHRMGYGAMQLAGPGVWGPPRDPEAALAVLRAAVAAGVDHIDTRDIYGPHVTNRLIQQALHPYAAGLTIATKVGAVRGPEGSWEVALAPEHIVSGVQDNLRNLGVEALDIVNLRLGTAVGTSQGSLAEPLAALMDLQRQGLVRHIGLGNVTEAQLEEGLAMTKIVCVQNHYNLAHRGDDAMIDRLARLGIAYVPFFPLGGFNPLQSAALDAAAAELRCTPMQLALAWLLERSPNILLIPGTSSVTHLRENLAAAERVIPPAIKAKLDALSS